MKAEGGVVFEGVTKRHGDVEAVSDVSKQVRGTWGICARRAVRKVFTDRTSRAYLMSAASRNRVFLLTVGRIWAAYRTGAMRYLVFRCAK